MTRPLAVLLAIALAVGACSDDGGAGGDRATPRVVLTVLAEEVIVPAYDALTTALDALGEGVDALCASPSSDLLEPARVAWRDANTAYLRTRAGDAGPAMDRKLKSTLGFRARPDSVDELLASGEPLDPDALANKGAAVRGMSALEIALFAPGADALATAEGGRRCEYVSSVAELAHTAAAEVLADWEGGYADEFVDGMEGDPQMSVATVVNSATFRMQEVHDHGVLSLVDVATPDDLPTNRRDGAAAVGIASLRAILGGVVAMIEGPDGNGLIALVRARSADTAERLQEAADRAVATLAELPESIAAALATPDAVREAAAAAGELKVLLGTEVASELGVTIGFSDADGDS